MSVPINQIPTSVLLSWLELADGPVETRGWGLVVTCSILGGVCVAVVSSRLWLRCVVQKKVDISDWFTLIALIFTLAFLLLSCLMLKVWGLDHHVYNLSVAQDVTLAKVFFTLVILTHWAEGFVRMSILLFYRLVLRNHSNRTFTVTLWTVFALVAGTMIASFIAMFLACTPLVAFWKMYDPVWIEDYSFTCTNHGAFLIATSALNACYDLIISLMPIFVLWNLQMPRRQKVAIWVLFSMGIFVSIAAMLRIYFCVVAFYRTYDFTWGAYGILLWTCIECPLALIGGSVPALKVVFSRYFDHKGSQDSTSNHATGGSSRSRSAHPSAAVSNNQLLPSWLGRSKSDDSDDTRYHALGEEMMPKGSGGSSSEKSDVRLSGTESGTNSRMDDWTISKRVDIEMEIDDMGEKGPILHTSEV